MNEALADPHDSFPEGFFARTDESSDSNFYGPPRLVTHIDNKAIQGVGALYTELGLNGRLLDLMSSWISHLDEKPEHLTIVGMNAAELEANPMADSAHVVDLNERTDLSVVQLLPFPDSSFDACMCAVSVDYLNRPLDVFAEVARVLVPNGIFVCTFSNRLFPTKAIHGWLAADDQGRCEIAAEYFRRSGRWTEPTIDVRIPPGTGTDPLYAVYARTVDGPGADA